MIHHNLSIPKVVSLVDQQPVGAAKNKGFTLLELIVVVTVLGVLAALSIPAYNIYVNKAKHSGAISDIRTLSTEITAYFIDRGTSPANLGTINRAGVKDPWKNAYVYEPIPVLWDRLNADKLNSDYDLYSTGSTGNGTGVAAGGDPANDDDIVRSNDGSFIGLRP